MENQVCLWLLKSDFLNPVNFFLAIFAAFISIGYLLKPRLRFYCYEHKNLWKVKVTNKNVFFVIKEIQCEIAASETEAFEYEKTLEMKKSSTLVLMRNRANESDDYIFRTHDTIKKIQEEHRGRKKEADSSRDYKYLHVRILAPNFLGVKKHYQKKYDISSLEKMTDTV
jgi:hypothetical protein